MHHDLIIRGGTLVLPWGEAIADVGVRDGRIAAVGSLAADSAGETIEATGLHVLPGLIDSHVHLRDPGDPAVETLETGTKAAVLGGIATLFDMPNTNPAIVDRERLDWKRGYVEGRSWCDIGLYVGGTKTNIDLLPELETEAGVCAVKVFAGSSTGTLMVEDDEHLERIMRSGRRRIAFHSENEYRLQARRPLFRPGMPHRSHMEWRDEECAYLGTRRLMALARRTGRPAHILHVSTAEELGYLRDFRDVATVEVLVNHLTQVAPDCYDRLGGFGVMNPPIRGERHRAASWAAVADGTVDTVGSDHAPHSRAAKALPWPECPAGLTGVQTLVPIMLDHVGAGRLSLSRLVDLMAAGPARVYGLVGKGRLAAGYDGDFTLVDMGRRRTIEDSWIASPCGWTPFAGTTVRGWPVATIVRGTPVMRDDEVLGAPPRPARPVPRVRAADMAGAPAAATGTTAVFGSHVLTLVDGVQAVLRDRWVVVEGDRIAAVTPHRPAGADRVLDRPGRFVLPGLLNLHNHCFSEAVARTHTEDGAGRRNNQSIVYTVLLPLTKRGIEILSPAERMDVARLGVLQLLKGGAATVMEPFRNGIPEMFDAALEMGLRFYGAPYLFSGSAPRADISGRVDYGASDAGEADLCGWNALHAAWEGRDGGRIRLAMSPHATDTCGPDLMRAAAARARDLGVPITTHLAQSGAEVATIAARHAGRTPAEYLDWLGLLAPDLLAAHCVACTDADLDLMAARGAAVLNCPRVFARAGTAAAYGRFAGRGLRTLVGTDGYNMDLIGELAAAATVSKIVSGRAETASAPDLIGAVTHEAAAAIGRPDLGAIRPGARADLTVVDLSGPLTQPLHDPRRALVWLANRADIDAVMVDGRLLIDGGRSTTVDEAAVTRAGAAAIEKIWALPEARAAFAG